MNEMKWVMDLFTKEETEKAFDICREEEFPAKRIAKEVVKPVIERINKDTGQGNSPRYMGHALENAYNYYKNKGK